MSFSYPRPLITKSAGRNRVVQTSGPALNEILEDICSIFNQPIEKIVSPGRKEELVCCKRIYCYVACLLTDACLDDIGSHINKDHTTVLHHRHTVIGWKSNNDPKFIDNWIQYVENSIIWKQYHPAN